MQQPLPTDGPRPARRSAHVSRGLIGIAAAVLTGLALLALSAGEARAAGYYVAPGGNDGASGKTPARAWRTVDRVNDANLRPGDVVHFRAGARFDDTLSPTTSGRRGAFIRYTSYGSGRAQIPGGVYLRNVSFIHVERLRIDGANHGVAGSSYDGGAKNITIARSVITNVGIGIIAPNPGDRSWRIVKNTITNTGDSAIIIEGGGFRVSGNTIANTGRDGSIDYAKHGVYAKGPNAHIVGNLITNFETEGVSTRYRNAHIISNTIRGGQVGVAYYRQDDAAGTTTICGNRISGVGYGIYIDPNGLDGSGSESFRLLLNRIQTAAGRRFIDVTGVGSTVLRKGNTVTGPPVRPAACA